uniref:EGF-like domain-containing protein n=1 Tax=Astyanax mexicanus TaxID=7994 RepID=A0A8B9HMH4_ASTMX
MYPPSPSLCSIDVNECEESTADCEGLCCNTIGSFYCKCSSGFTLRDDGKTCEGRTFKCHHSLKKDKSKPK